MFFGLDIHKRNAQVAVRNDGGTVIEEFRVKNGNLDEVGEEYAGRRAVLEATSNFYLTYDMLSEHLDVCLAHPTKITEIGESDKKTDQVLTRNISRLL